MSGRRVDMHDTRPRSLTPVSAPALAPAPAPAPSLSSNPAPTLAKPRGRLFRTRSGNLVDAQELRRRRQQQQEEAAQRQQEDEEQRKREQGQQRELDEALLATVMDGIGNLHIHFDGGADLPVDPVAAVGLCMDHSGRWRIRRPEPGSPPSPADFFDDVVAPVGR